MPQCDLEEVRAQVDLSRKDFLEANEVYKSYDGQKIVEKFLSKFKDRSEVTHDLEQETEQLITTFDKDRASLATDIALGLMRMLSTVSALGLYIMAEGIKKVGEPPKIPPGASPMDVVRAQMGKMDEAQKAVSGSGKWAEKTACGVGLHIARVITMAADILRIRTLTLRVFKEENIGTSFSDLLQQMRDREYAHTGILVLDAAWDRIREVVKELIKFIAGKNPSVELFNFVKGIANR